MRRRDRWLALGLLAAFGSSASGCALLYRNKMSLKRDYILTDPFDKQGPRDRFFEWRGKAKPAVPSSGIFVAPFVLRQPFSVEAQIGIFDPDELAGSAGATGCLEIDEEEFFGTVFFYMCLLYLVSPTPGVQVFTSVDDNTQFYPAIYGGTVRMESNDTTLSLLFQPLGGSTFDVITTTPFANPTLGYNPSIGAVNLPKGGVIDFQDVRYASTPKTDPEPVDEIAEAIGNALARLNEGCLFVDGASPDFTGAALEVNNSFGFITEARNLLPSLGDPRLASRVGAKIDCMDKNAARALVSIGDLSVASAIKRFEKSLRCGAEGLTTLRDFQVDF